MTNREKKIFDKETFLQAFSGMETLAHDVTQDFLNTLPDMLFTIEQSIKDQKVIELERSAHTLKGTLSHFYAGPAQDAAWALEKLGKSKNMIGAEDLYQNLLKEVNQLKDELQITLTAHFQK